MPLVCLVLTHYVVVLVIAEFCTIRRVLIESVARDRCNEFNARCGGRDGEVELSLIARFVVVRAVKLAAAEGVGSVHRSTSTPPIAEQERDGQIPSIGSCVLEATLFSVVEHEQVR